MLALLNTKEEEHLPLEEIIYYAGTCVHESILDYLDLREILRNYDVYRASFATLDKYLFNNTGKTYEQLTHCAHENCGHYDEYSIITNFCVNHVIFHQCVKCFTVHENSDDLLRINTYRNY